MSQNSVQLSGQITVGNGVCIPCDGAPSTKVQSLSLACNGVGFPCIVSTDAPKVIQTAGVLGAEFVELPASSDIGNVEFLFVNTSTLMRLRIGAAAARVLGSGGTFPTSFGGGETLIASVDGAAFTTTFTAAAQLAADVVNEINAAAALAGIAFQPASVDASGQIALQGVLTGPEGTVVITGGTGAATLGLSGSAVGAGSDIDVQGTFLNEFGRSNPNAPARIQVSGVGNVTVLAAGTTP